MGLVHFKIFCVILMIVGLWATITGYLGRRKLERDRRRIQRMLDESRERVERRLSYINYLTEGRRRGRRRGIETTDEILRDLYRLLEEWEGERTTRTAQVAQELGDIRMAWETPREKVNWLKEGF
jgi:hypothetical protein